MDGNDIKLEFTVEEDSGLVFESEPIPSAQDIKPTLESKPESDTKLEFVAKAEQTPLQSPDGQKPQENKTELYFDVNPSVRMTYVPRFTEVSENYHFAEQRINKPDVQPASAPKPAKAAAEEHASSAIDPTAELDDGATIAEARLVSIGTAREQPQENVSTVFKFDITPEPPVSTPQAEPEFVVEQTNDDEKAESVPEQQPEEQGNTEYVMPEPDIAIAARAIAERRDNSALVETPDNIGDKADGKSKKHGEYNSYADRDKCKDSFLDSILSVKIRLVASMVIMAVLFFVENLWALFKVDIPQLIGFSAFDGAMAIIDLQFVACLFILSLPEVISAFRRLFIGKATPELFIPCTAVILFAYYLVLIFNPSSAEYPLFGLIFAMLTVGAILGVLYKKIADFETFKLLATDEVKKVADKKSTRELEDENHAVDGKVESYKSKTVRFFNASFISDFFKRSGKSAENSSGVLTILGATFALALVAGAVAFFLLDGIASALTAMASVFMFGVPVFAVLTHKLSFFHSTKEALSEKCMIIGESSLYDYSGVDVITFRDTEVFSDEDVSLQRVMLYGKSENMSKALQQMASLFSVVGGPLKILFTDSLDHLPANAAKVRIESEGVVGELGGKIVRAGSLEYMARNNVRIPEDNTKEPSLFSTKIIYASEDEEVFAKFYIRYALSEDFTMIRPVLEDDGITPLIYTRDPNLSNEFLRTFTAGSDFIRVLKKSTLPEDENAVYRSVRVGIATLGDKSNLINMILLSKKYVRFQRRMALFELMSMAVGAILGAVLSLSGMMAVPSAVLAVWQLAWCLALVFMSRRTILTKNQKGKSTANER